MAIAPTLRKFADNFPPGAKSRIHWDPSTEP